MSSSHSDSVQSYHSSQEAQTLSTTSTSSDEVSYPSTPFFHPNRNTCDYHERAKRKCDFNTVMCQKHSKCRKEDVPQFRSSSLFISCDYCIEWYLWVNFRKDRIKYEEMTKLVMEQRKGNAKIEALRSLQDLLESHCKLYKSNRELQAQQQQLEKHKVDLESEILTLERKRRRTSERACEMEDIIAELWYSQVLECFDGIVKYFNFIKKHPNEIDHVSRWMFEKDNDPRSTPNSPKYLKFEGSWCQALRDLPQEDIMSMVYREWLNNRFISEKLKQSRHYRSNYNWTFQTSMEQYLYFVRDMTAHYGDNPQVFRSLHLQSYKIVEKSMMLLFDELSGPGLHGVLKCLTDEDTPVEVKSSIQCFLNFDLVKSLLCSRIVRWPTRNLMSMKVFIANNLNR